MVRFIGLFVMGVPYAIFHVCTFEILLSSHLRRGHRVFYGNAILTDAVHNYAAITHI